MTQLTTADGLPGPRAPSLRGLPRGDKAARLDARAAAALLATSVCTCLLAVAAVQLTRVVGAVAGLWLANAVALFGWLKARRSRTTDAIYFGALGAAFLASEILIGNTPLQIAVFATLDTLEVSIAVCLVRRLLPDGPRLSSTSGVAQFLGVCLAAPLLSSGIAALSSCLRGVGRPLDVFAVWELGHALGFAVLTPFLFSLKAVGLKHRRIESGIILSAVAVLVTWIMLSGPRGMGFLLYPVLLLATVRLRLFGAATASLIVTLVQFGFTMDWIADGRIARAAAAGAVQRLQLYVIFGCLPTLLIAAALTERDRYARSAAQRQAEAEAASAGKSKLLANVSHEVRTPLNAILAFGDMLLGEQMGPLNEGQKDLMRTMVASASQLNALAQDLTDVAKAEAGKLVIQPREMQVWTVVEEVCAQLRPKADAAGADLRLQQPPADLTAFADPIRVAQILTNLVSNAIKYAGADGPIRVRAYRRGDALRIEVHDSGPGIRTEYREELFEPFNRLGKEAGSIEGTGIGLAISRRLAELQSGALGYESEPGEGARFWLDLPLAGKALKPETVSQAA